MASESELVEQHADQLSEHFDSVFIICTRVEDGTGVTCKRRGNYYATKGAITEWLEQERNQDLAKQIAEKEDE